MNWLTRRLLGTSSEHPARSAKVKQEAALSHIDSRLTDVEKRLHHYEIKVDARLAALEYRKDVISRERNPTPQ